MATVRLDRVSKSFGQLKALADVSFECGEGEFFTLFGPSGAGKTTTLELIAGINDRYHGDIYIGDRRMRGVPLQERDIAMAFENYALYPHMTVEENIGFPLRSPRAVARTEAEIDTRVREAADQLGIGQLLDRNPVQLSGGQKQRVSLARALVREPEVFLLDEPIAHLDAKLRAAARANLKDIAHRIGTTIIYVTHDYREALGMSDRICVLREGKVEQIGAPREIYGNPASDFVAHLIGDPVTNLIDGELAVDGDTLWFRSSAISIPLTDGSKSRLKDRPTGVVRFGIRPKDVKARVESADGSAPMTVFSVERSVDTNLIHIDIGPTIIAAMAPERTALRAGDPVWLDFDADNAMFFDSTFEISK